MTTSDSEDFESADEDIESDNFVLTSSSHSKHGPTDSDNVTTKDPKTTENAKEFSSRLPSETTAGTIDKEFSPGTSEVLSERLKEDCVFKDDEGSKDNNERGNDTVSETGVPPGSLETSQESLKQKSGRPDRAGRPQKSRENKSGPMKLGVRVTTDTPLTRHERPIEKLEAPQEHTTEMKSEEKPEGRGDSHTCRKGDVPTYMSPANSQEKQRAEQQPSQSSGWGFGKGLMATGGLGSLGGWGSSLLSTATLSVSTLGSHVTQGISTVLETVEAGIGAPSPEDMARKLREEDEKSEDRSNEKEKTQSEGDDTGELEMEAWGDWKEDDGCAGDDIKGGGAGLLSLVTGVTQVTGKVLSTGLDTLEVIGKKTMEVLQEGDPGLKKKRALLLGRSDSVVLSQVLREAKEKAEAEAKVAEEKEAARKAHFETLFDDFQGLVHLEALEMLSRQSDLRLKSMLLKESGPALRGLQIRLAAVQEMCEVPDLDDSEVVPILSEVLSEALKVLNIEVSADKLMQCLKESHDRLTEMKAEVDDDGVSRAVPRIIHQEAITALATLTAHAIEVFHKVTELLLVKEAKGRDVKDEAKALVSVTSALVSEVNKIATEFSDFLSAKLNDDSLNDPDKEKVESYITSTFLEASNSSTYIQDAFQLMVPVLQIGAIA